MHSLLSLWLFAHFCVSACGRNASEKKLRAEPPGHISPQAPTCRWRHGASGSGSSALKGGQRASLGISSACTPHPRPGLALEVLPSSLSTFSVLLSLLLIMKLKVTDVFPYYPPMVFGSYLHHSLDGAKWVIIVRTSCVVLHGNLNLESCAAIMKLVPIWGGSPSPPVVVAITGCPLGWCLNNALLTFTGDQGHRVDQDPLLHHVGLRSSSTYVRVFFSNRKFKQLVHPWFLLTGQ